MQHHPQAPFARSFATLLAQIYDLGMRLPEVDPGTAEVSTLLRATHERLRDAIGAHDAYWFIFDPFDEGNKVAASLYADLTSIYEDVVGPLALFDRADEDALHTALWQWRFNLETHTGNTS